jgi:hypothetical protein
MRCFFPLCKRSMLSIKNLTISSVLWMIRGITNVLKTFVFWGITLHSPVKDKQISLVPAVLLHLLFNPTVFDNVNTAVSNRTPQRSDRVEMFCNGLLNKIHISIYSLTVFNMKGYNSMV